MPHPFCFKLPKCKSHAYRRAKAEVRGASPRGSTTSCGHRPAAGHGYAKAETSVQIRLTALFLNSSVADTARHLSRKQDHVGANPTGGSISNSLHSVTAAFLVVNEAVRIRLREPFHHRAHGEVVEPVVCKSTLPGASPGRTSINSSDTREPENSLGLGPRSARGGTGVSDHFHWSVA